MHESTLARALFNVVLDEATRANASKILCIHAWVAETEAISPEAIEFHFRALARETIAAKARLLIKTTHVSVRCLSCGTDYPPDHHVTLCPNCASTEAELLGNVGFGIDHLEIEL